ncbi:DUF4190 domain-containing protein [Streptomyces bauhiniae]|uniref:DUF4190 domain-containing protein n=1 Tax=Streptomyces bauhiniae TaxID=2340725 RepID=UPI0033242847
MSVPRGGRSGPRPFSGLVRTRLPCAHSYGSPPESPRPPRLPQLVPETVPVSISPAREPGDPEVPSEPSPQITSGGPDLSGPPDPSQAPSLSGAPAPYGSHDPAGAPTPSGSLDPDGVAASHGLAATYGSPAPSGTPTPYGSPNPHGTPTPYGPPNPYAPYGPHAPYGTPTPYAPPTPNNPFAIASLVAGILCCLPGVGLILGLVALLQIRKRGQRGWAAAVIGSVLSGIGLGLAVVLLATDATGWMWRNVKDGVRESVGLSLAKGDCFDSAGGDLAGAVYDIRTVPCEGAHEGEVFATFAIKGGPYPGDAVVEDAAERCVGLLDAYAMDAWALPDDADVFHVTPTKETWSLGDREVTCVLGSTTEGGTLTGSLRADESTLDADQLAYLKGAHVLNAALDSEPDTELVEDDLPGHKAWARRVSGALATWSHTLRTHPWPAAARAPMADLAARLDKSRPLWDKAARATDADAFYVSYDAALTLLDRDADIPARKSLRLAATPPDSGAQEADGDAADGDAKV